MKHKVIIYKVSSKKQPPSKKMHLSSNCHSVSNTFESVIMTTTSISWTFTYYMLVTWTTSFFPPHKTLAGRSHQHPILQIWSWFMELLLAQKGELMYPCRGVRGQRPFKTCLFLHRQVSLSKFFFNETADSLKVEWSISWQIADNLCVGKFSPRTGSSAIRICQTSPEDEGSMLSLPSWGQWLPRAQGMGWRQTPVLILDTYSPP